MADSDSGQEGLATVDECMEFLSVGRTTVYAMIQDGELPSVKVRGTRRVPWAALHELEARAMHTFDQKDGREVLFDGGPCDGLRIKVIDGPFPDFLYVALAGDGGLKINDAGKITGFKFDSDTYVCQYELDMCEIDGEGEITEMMEGRGPVILRCPDEYERRLHCIRKIGTPKT